MKKENGPEQIDVDANDDMANSINNYKVSGYSRDSSLSTLTHRS